MSDQNNLETIEKAIQKLNEEIILVENELMSYCQRFIDGKFDVLKFTDSINLLEKRIEQYHNSKTVLINKRQVLKSQIEG